MLGIRRYLKIASYVKISPRKKITKNLKKKRKKEKSYSAGNVKRRLRMHGRKSTASSGAEDKFCFTLLCHAQAARVHARTRVNVCARWFSQRRNRRGSFQATPVRTRRSRLLPLPISLFPSATAFLVASIDPIEPRLRRRPRRRIHFRARCYRGEVRVCRRHDTYRYI